MSREWSSTGLVEGPVTRAEKAEAELAAFKDRLRGEIGWEAASDANGYLTGREWTQMIEAAISAAEAKL